MGRWVGFSIRLGLRRGQDMVIAEDDGLGILLVGAVVVKETQIGVELVVIAEC